MKPLLQHKTRGEATIIGYTLLIVLALAMGVIVYGFLQFYVPKEKMQCPSDVSLVVQNVVCRGQQINITISNKGLFSVDGAYIKIGKTGRVFKEIVNCDPMNEVTLATSCFFHDASTVAPLTPGSTFNSSYMYQNATVGEHEVEILPFILEENNRSRTFCSEAVTSQRFSCS